MSAEDVAAMNEELAAQESKSASQSSVWAKGSILPMAANVSLTDADLEAEAKFYDALAKRESVWSKMVLLPSVSPMASSFTNSVVKAAAEAQMAVSSKADAIAPMTAMSSQAVENHSMVAANNLAPVSVAQSSVLNNVVNALVNGASAQGLMSSALEGLSLEELTTAFINAYQARGLDPVQAMILASIASYKSVGVNNVVEAPQYDAVTEEHVANRWDSIWSALCVDTSYEEVSSHLKAQEEVEQGFFAKVMSLLDPYDGQMLGDVTSIEVHGVNHNNKAVEFKMVKAPFERYYEPKMALAKA